MTREELSSDVQLRFIHELEAIPLASVCLDTITFVRGFDYDAATGIVEIWVNDVRVSARQVSIQRGIGRQFTVTELNQ